MKILAVVVNNPAFIELQYKSIQRFVSPEVEFIIFNDAKAYPDITNMNDCTMRSQIEEKCRELHLQCIPIETPANKLNASVRHSISLNFMTQWMKENKDQYWVIDSDMFFIADFDINMYRHRGFAYVESSRTINNTRIVYPWGNLFYIDFTQDISPESMSWNVDHGLDTGGKNWKWLAHLPTEMKEAFPPHYRSLNWNSDNIPKHVPPLVVQFIKRDLRNQRGQFFSELYLDSILHFRAASGWMQEAQHMNQQMIHVLETALLTFFS